MPGAETGVASERPTREIAVPNELAESRLDRALALLLGVSRRQARELLTRGAVSLNGRVARLANKGDAVAAGDRLVVEEIPPPANAAVIPQPELPLDVLARGPGWLALDKPAGMPVHPLREGERGTLLNALAARCPEVQGVGEAGLRSGVVHRLDVDTSGVLLVATTAVAWERLRGAFREHRVDKRYRAIVWGALRDEHHMECGLAVAQHRPARVRVVPEREDSTDATGATRSGVWRVEQYVRPLEALRGATLVEVRPRTGFLHQIRATLAHLGHPVVGDAIYGGAQSPEAAGQPRADRHMLHAAAAALEEDVRAAAPDPPDFEALLVALREDAEPRGGDPR